MAKRVCRVCGSEYDYPVPRSLATRLHCEECISIDKRLRRVLEKVRRRTDRLAAEVEALTKKLQDRAEK